MVKAADHALAMTTTNTGAFVPTCRCGWYGRPHPVPVTVDKRDKRKRHPALAERDAVSEFNTHAYTLDPGADMRNYRCEACRRECVMVVGALACPHCGGSLNYARVRL